MKQKKQTRREAQEEAKHWKKVARAAADFAQDFQTRSAHLARVLAFVIARDGKPLVISDDELDMLPKEAKLAENYDAETASSTFACVTPKPKPKIEIASDAQVAQIAEEQAGLRLVQ